MAKPKVYKCGFRHCQHESCEVSQEEAVQVGRRYFHSDCAEIYYNMQEIQRLYREKISNTVVMPQLLSVINNIVFTKHIESSYLLFALKFAINTKISILFTYRFLNQTHSFSYAVSPPKSSSCRHQTQNPNILPHHLPASARPND